MKNYTNIKKIKEDFFKQKEIFKKLKQPVLIFNFTYKKFEIGIRYESDESVQYYILSVNSFNLSGSVVEELNEIENIEHIDDYLYALENGDFDYLENAPSYNFRDWVFVDGKNVYVDETIKAINREVAIEKMKSKYQHIFRYVCELS